MLNCVVKFAMFRGLAVKMLAFSLVPPSVTCNAVPTIFAGVPLNLNCAAAQFKFNGTPAKIVGTALQVTDGGTNEKASIFTANPLNIANFTTQFSIQLLSGTKNIADGMTFTIQGV